MWYEKAIHEFWISCPPGVPADLKSAVKKCPNLFRICGFEIRSNQDCKKGLGDYKSPGFKRSNIF